VTFRTTDSPRIVPRDSGGRDFEWQTREFEIQVCFTADGRCEGVFIDDKLTGYKLDWDDAEGLEHG
jgi:hypothetical protein